jgi:hypothetical protein
MFCCPAKSKNYSEKLLWGATLLVSVLLVAGCVTYSTKEPKRGVTTQLVKGMSEHWRNTPYSRNDGGYDWSKLKGDYGLYVFSYKVRGRSGTNFTGSGLTTKEGFRVWEHKFLENESDSVREAVSFDATDVSHRGGYIETTYFTKISILPVYKKGRVVYGGLIDVAANEAFPDVFTRFTADSLWEQFLSFHSENLVGIPIDTVAIEEAKK